MSDVSRFRTLPSVQEVLRRPELAALSAPRSLVLDVVREAIALRREQLRAGASAPTEITIAELTQAIAKKQTPSLREVINATGVVIHTNLGRSPLAERAIAAIERVSRGFSTLEYNLARGERGSRHDHVTALAASLCGAEDALVVNNNAAAVLLCLSAMASGREVLVSRGELVEIGGSFRIPEILALSGARLVEVGATNRTHLRDYASAITAQSALLLRVHRANFAMLGFVSEPSRAELVLLAREKQLPILEDLGSGCLVEEFFGKHREPTPREALEAGVEVVTISGDKLLGGPQAGIILGRREILSRIKKHPLARAVRIDKLSLAALEATLSLYRDAKTEEIPTLAMLRSPAEVLQKRARSLARKLKPLCPQLTIRVEAVIERVGGGALPLAELPGYALRCTHENLRPNALEAKLREHQTPIIARVEDDAVYLHLRTVLPSQESTLLAALSAL